MSPRDGELARRRTRRPPAHGEHDHQADLNGTRTYAHSTNVVVLAGTVAADPVTRCMTGDEGLSGRDARLYSPSPSVVDPSTERLMFVPGLAGMDHDTSESSSTNILPC